MRKRFFFFSTVIALIASVFVRIAPAEAAGPLIDTWSSVRAQGMGGAYTAVVDNADALFYNPAGLARSGGFDWTILDLHPGLNGLKNIQELQDIMSSNNNMIQNLQKLYGKKVWAGVGAKSALKIGNLAVAGFGNAEAGISVSNPANTTMDLNYFLDYGFAAGAGFDVVPEIFKMGMTARRVDRTGTTLPIGAATLATLDVGALTDQLKRQGIGYGLDVGSLLTIPGPVSPTLSLVYRNVGGVRFSHIAGAGPPPSIPGELVVGGALAIKSGLVDIRPTFDYRFADRSDVALGKKVHIGVEVDLPLIDLRAGLNQGYYTLGVGLDLALMRIDVATYGVELGAYPGQLEDRRYVAQLTFELGFDPSLFGLGSSSQGSGTSSTGERRRLKQRR